jgi:hypothetical protein
MEMKKLAVYHIPVLILCLKAGCQGLLMEVCRLNSGGWRGKNVVTAVLPGMNSLLMICLRSPTMTQSELRPYMNGKGREDLRGFIMKK